MSKPNQIKPDYEVTAQLVTFRGKTRSAAIKKLVKWMESKKVKVWIQDTDFTISTGTGNNGNGDDYFFASAIGDYHHAPFHTN
jgi:hypothetical protein